MPESGESVTGHSGARRLLAAADKIEGRIVEAEKMRTALEEIKRLHAEAAFWDDDAQPGERIRMVCNICCLDPGGYPSDECEESHEHSADGPACSTAEIIARCGL